MRLYLVRHAQSTYNVRGIFNGDPSVDVPLTDMGVVQAKLAGQRLAGKAFEIVYVSQMVRTQQTAHYINEARQVPVVIEPRLNDINSGFEGRPTPEYHAALDASFDRWSARFNDGESWQDMVLRVAPFVDQLRASSQQDMVLRVAPFVDQLRASSQQAVVVVTSAYIIQVIEGIVNGWSIQQMWDRDVIDNADFRIIEL